MVTSDADFFANLPQAREFLGAVEPMLPAYRHGLFSYVALRHEGEQVLLRARFELSTETRASSIGSLETRNLCAGQVRIKDLDPTAAETCVRRAAAQEWLPPVGNQLLKLLCKSDSASRRYDSYYECPPIRQVESAWNQTIDRLVLSGINRFQLLSPRMRELERELHEKGVDSLEDLMRIYELRGSDETTLEVVTTPVAWFDPQTQLSGRHVRLVFHFSPTLHRDLLNVVVKNADLRTRDIPRTLNGSQINWIEHHDRLEGLWELDLPESQIIDCRVVYAGRPQAELRLADIDSLPNPRRTLVSLVDPKLRRLEKVILEPGKNEGRDFEAGVGWLFQLLGFAPIHVGGMSGMSGEPDILVTGPDGEVLIVECTTGVPDDDKLTLLISRAARIRENHRRIQGANTGGHNVITMIISSRPPEELAGIRAKAEKHSIVVLCQPDLQEALARTRFAPDPHAVLQRWRNTELTRIMTGERLLGID